MAAMGNDERVFGFSEANHDELLAGIGRPQQLPPSVPRGRQGGYIALTPSGGIPKRVGTTVSFATCPIYFLAGTGSTRTLTSTGISLPVGNMSSAEDVGGNQYIMCDMRGGELLCDWEDCQA